MVEGETRLQQTLVMAPLLRTFGRWDENAGKLRAFGRCAGWLLLRKELEGPKEAKPHHRACTGTAAISLLLKESEKREDRLLLRKELEGPKEAKPHHRAYTGTAAISLLPKESGKRADRLLLRKE